MNERRYAFAIEMATLPREMGDLEAAQKWYAEAWKEINTDNLNECKFYLITDKRQDA